METKAVVTPCFDKADRKKRGYSGRIKSGCGAGTSNRSRTGQSRANGTGCELIKPRNMGCRDRSLCLSAFRSGRRQYQATTEGCPYEKPAGLRGSCPAGVSVMLSRKRLLSAQLGYSDEANMVLGVGVSS